MIAAERFTVTTTVTAICTPRSDVTVVVVNADATNPVYLGDSAVTTGTGLELAAGESVSLNLTSTDVLYAISGGTVTVHTLRTGPGA